MFAHISMNRPSLRQIIAGTAIGALGLFHVSSVSADVTPAAATHGKTRSFVVTYLVQPENWKLYKNNEDCPQGYNRGIADAMANGSHSNLVQGLNKIPNSSTILPIMAYANVKFVNGQMELAPPGFIAKPWLFENAPAKYVQGGLSEGMNLTGVNAEMDPGSATVKPHQKFRSPSGEFVDNEMFRALGCYHGFRQKDPYNFGAQEDQQAAVRQSGVTTTLIEVSGIDNDMNDDDVRVGIYLSADPVVVDPTKPGEFNPGLFKGLAHVSYTVKEREGYDVVLKGKIVNGVLTTEPGDFHVESALFEPVADEDYFFHGGRVRFDMKKDYPTGLMAGYFDLKYAYNMWAKANPGLGGPHGLTAAGMYEAMHDLADGYLNPKTGEYTAISAQFNMELAPAYVFHQKNGAPNASASAETTKVAAGK